MVREAFRVIDVGVFRGVSGKPDCVLKLHCTFTLSSGVTAITRATRPVYSRENARRSRPP